MLIHHWKKLMPAYSKEIISLKPSKGLLRKKSHSIIKIYGMFNLPLRAHVMKNEENFICFPILLCVILCFIRVF